MEASSASPTSALPPPAPATAAPIDRQPLTKEQRDAIFAKAAATMQPTRAPAGNELLEWKPQIMEYYAKGFSAGQIREILQAGNVVTSDRVVQRFVAKYSHHKRASKSRRSATLAANSSPGSAIAAPAPATETPAARQPAASKTLKS